MEVLSELASTWVIDLDLEPVCLPRCLLLGTVLGEEGRGFTQYILGILFIWIWLVQVMYGVILSTIKRKFGESVLGI